MMELGSKEIITELARNMPDKTRGSPDTVIMFIIRHPRDSGQNLLPQQMSKGCKERYPLSGNKMSQTRRIPRRFAPSSYPDGAPEEETYSNLQTISGTTEQMEFNISSATQVGHQLALIGDEFNRTYNRKFEDTLLHLAHGVAISVFQTWNIIRSVIRSFGNILNSNWTKRIIDYGSWICRLPFRCVCQKLVPAALLVVAFWWAMNYGLQN